MKQRRVAALAVMVAALLGLGGFLAPAHAADKTWTCKGSGVISTSAYFDNHLGGYWSGFADGSGSESCTAALPPRKLNRGFTVSGFSGDPCWTADAVNFESLWLTMGDDRYVLSRDAEVVDTGLERVDAPTSVNAGYQVRGLIMAFRYGYPTPRPIGTYQFTLGGDPGCGPVNRYGDLGFTGAPFTLNLTFAAGLAQVSDAVPWPLPT